MHMTRFPAKALGAGFLKGMLSKYFGRLGYTYRDIQEARSSAYYSNFRVEDAITKFTVEWVQALRIPDNTYKVNVSGVDIELRPGQSAGLSRGNSQSCGIAAVVCHPHELIGIMDEMIQPLKEAAKYMTVNIPSCIPGYEDCNKQLHISLARKLAEGSMQASEIRKKSEELATLARIGGYQTSRKDLERYFPG
jgi:hypothetical protein